MRLPIQLFAASLFLPAGGQAGFILPEVPAGAQTQFAWWDGFTDPHTDYQLPGPGESVPPLPGNEGNAVNRPEATNTDPLLYQTGTSTAFITSTGGIYSFAEPVAFLIHDAPAFEADSVLLQTSSLGSLPDLDSARLFYRETAGGSLLEADGPTGTGFLEDGSLSYAMWEWDLTGETIFDYFLLFDSADSTMSLQEVQLDTFDQATDELGVALLTETTSNFAAVGVIEHNRAGETSPSPSYFEGDTVEVAAVPEAGSGYVFLGWQGDVSGTAPNASFTVSGQPSVKAVFGATDYGSWTFNRINPYITAAPFQDRAEITADPDGDGLVNLLEYALGGAPESAEDLAAVVPQASVDGHGRPALVFRRQMAAADLLYRVKVSTDLIDWNYNGDGTGLTYTEELPGPTFNGDGTETVTVRALESSVSGSPVFLRLEVLHQP